MNFKRTDYNFQYSNNDKRFVLDGTFEGRIDDLAAIVILIEIVHDMILEKYPYISPLSLMKETLKMIPKNKK